MIKFIASGGYVCNELAAELGKLPPSFLPVGNKRLYEYQVDFLKQHGNGDIYISLPDDYKIPKMDLDYFLREKIEIISTNQDNSISESISYCLNAIQRYSESLMILWGDTLIKSKLPDVDKDLAIISSSGDNYKWGYYQDKIYTGFFSISSQKDFIISLNRNKADFIKAFTKYSKIKYTIYHAINSDSWLDFGHLNTYFRSRSQISTTRHFNNFNCDGQKVIKTSPNTKKIMAEARWYKNIPWKISIYSPKLLNIIPNGYLLEYLYLLPLNEIFIYGNLPVNIWNKILLSCKDFLSLCKNYKSKKNPQINTISIYKNKTLERLSKFSKEQNINLNSKILLNNIKCPSILEIANICINNLSIESLIENTLIHGDFCFSNILYDFRSQLVKVVDPRGLDGNNDFSICGDSRYDIAKLAHSIIGGYDHIIAGYQTCGEIIISDDLIMFNNYCYYTNNETEKIREIFKELFISDLNIRIHIYSIMVLLFLSMLPLHNDNINKQNAILATGIFLFKEFLDK